MKLKRLRVLTALLLVCCLLMPYLPLFADFDEGGAEETAQDYVPSTEAEIQAEPEINTPAGEQETNGGDASVPLREAEIQAEPEAESAPQVQTRDIPDAISDDPKQQTNPSAEDIAYGREAEIQAEPETAANAGGNAFPSVPPAVPQDDPPATGTDGESYYTVSFTRSGATYNVSAVKNPIKVSDIATALGITGTITNVESDNDSTNSAYHLGHYTITKENNEGNDEWFIQTTSPRSYTSNYRIRITVGEITYSVNLKYVARPISDNDPGAIEGVTVGGSVYTFASGMPLSTIYIDNAYFQTPSSYKIISTNPGFVMFTSSTAFASEVNDFIGYDPTKTGATKLSANKDNFFEGDLFSFTYNNAAILHDGTVANVRITYSDLHISVDSRVGENPFNYKISLAKGKHLKVKTSDNSSSQSAFDGEPYYDSKSAAVRMNAKIQIVDNSGNPIPGSFIVACTGINVARYGTMIARPIHDRHLYDDYSESFQVNGGRLCDIYVRPNSNVLEPSTGGSEYQRKYYYPYVTESEGGIKFTGVQWQVPGRTDPAQGPNGTYSAGFVTTMDAYAGAQMTNYSVGNKDVLDTYYMDGYSIWHRIRSSSTRGGTIQTTTKANHSGALSDGGSVLEPGTYVVPDGKTVVYTMTPDPGYELDTVTVAENTLSYTHGGVDKTDVVKTNVVYNTDGSVKYYTFTFPTNMKDEAIHVKWKKSSSENLTVKKQTLGGDGKFTFRIKAGGDLVVRNAWKKIASWQTSWSPKNSFAYVTSRAYPIVLDGTTYNTDYLVNNTSNSSGKLLLYGDCAGDAVPQSVTLTNDTLNTSKTLYRAKSDGHVYQLTYNGEVYELYSDTKNWDISSESGSTGAGFWVHDPNDIFDDYDELFVVSTTSTPQAIDFSSMGGTLVPGTTDVYEFTITTSGGEGSITFPDLPYGYAYEITEMPASGWQNEGNSKITGYTYSDKTETFTNRKLYDLSVTKNVSGNLGSKAMQWNFTLTVPSLAGASAAVTYKGNPETWSFDANGKKTFTLAHGETLKISLPYETAYTVEEETVSSYTQKYRIGSAALTAGVSTGSQTLTTDTAVVFNNELNISPPTGIYDSVIPALCMIALAAIGLALIFVGRRRRANG